MVWPEPHDGTVHSVASMVFEMAGSAVGINGEVDVGYGGEAWAGVFGQRVEGQPVNDDGRDLGVVRLRV